MKSKKTIEPPEAAQAGTGAWEPKDVKAAKAGKAPWEPKDVKAAKAAKARPPRPAGAGAARKMKSPDSPPPPPPLPPRAPDPEAPTIFIKGRPAYGSPEWAATRRDPNAPLKRRGRPPKVWPEGSGPPPGRDPNAPKKTPGPKPNPNRVVPDPDAPRRPPGRPRKHPLAAGEQPAPRPPRDPNAKPAPRKKITISFREDGEYGAYNDPPSGPAARPEDESEDEASDPDQPGPPGGPRGSGRPRRASKPAADPGVPRPRGRPGPRPSRGRGGTNYFQERPKIAPIQTEASLMSVWPVGGDYHLLTLATREGRWPALGRFIKIRAVGLPPEGGRWPLLDRPFSIHRVVKGARLQILVKNVGPASGILAGCEPGQKFRVTGPLGRGLDSLVPNYRNFKWYLVAGGAGLGPMAGLVDALGPRRVTLFYGERREEDLVDRFYLEKLVGRNYEATAEILEPRPPEEPGGLGAEDLSFPDSELAGLGYPLEGLVTGPLSEALAAEKRPVFACGPPGLLGALAGLAEGAGVPYFACAEATMGCGLGVCLSCSLPGAGGRNFKVCQDGPVVNGLEIDWKKINAR